jgi:hypothetical protein
MFITMTPGPGDRVTVHRIWRPRPRGAGRARWRALAWCADPDPHLTTILTTRMPDVPNLGDFRTVDWSKAEPIEVLTAGFPCQDISATGQRAGIEKGERSGLWTDIVAAPSPPTTRPSSWRTSPRCCAGDTAITRLR